MRRLGTHISLIQGVLNDLHANQKRGEIVKATNAVLEMLAGEFSIGLLCRSATVTASAKGAYLPSNLAGFNRIVESSTGREAYRRGEGAAINDEEIYRYYTDFDTTAESDSALPFTGYGSIAAKSSEVVSEELLALSETETLTGLNLMLLDPDYGAYYYTITGVTETGITIDGVHPYQETQVSISVRPNHTPRIHFVDASEEKITGTQFDIYYWIYPNPLTQDSDIIPLIYADAIEVMTVRRIPETKDRRPVSKTEIEEAKKIAQAREPSQGIPARPLSEQGNVFTLSPKNKSPYKMRGE
jgi:hypothetical protein